MTKHTLGPWITDREYKDGWQFCVHSKNGTLIAEITNLVKKPEDEGRIVSIESDANAHLIAAAPELLAALDELHTIASLRCGHEIDKEVLSMAKAAIAKATQTT